MLRAVGVNAKTGSTGFYREDAARLASEAARRPPQSLETPQAAPEVLLDEAQRPPLRPDPASNQNDRQARFSRLEVEYGRGFGLARVVAWVMLAPFYAATLVGSVGLNVVFIRGLLRI